MSKTPDFRNGDHGGQPLSLSGEHHRTDLVALNFKVPLAIRTRLKVLAATRGVSMTTLMLEAISLLDEK
jgi:hypothetical protein